MGTQKSLSRYLQNLYEQGVDFQSEKVPVDEVETINKSLKDGMTRRMVEHLALRVVKSEPKV